MPINPAMIGNIRDRVTNLKKSSGSLNDEWVKLKAMLNDAKSSYSDGSLDENDIDELYKQAKKLGKAGFKTYQELNSTYTSAREAYNYFVSYLNRHRPEGERNFQPPPPPPQQQAPQQAPPPPPDIQPTPPPPQQQAPQQAPPPPPDVPQSNTNWFYDRAREGLNAINPFSGITDVEGGLIMGALGTAYGARSLMSRNRLNRDVVENQQRGGRLAQQIQERAVQGLGNAMAEQIPRAGINSLQNLMNEVNMDMRELDNLNSEIARRQQELARQTDLAQSEAQRALREQQRRPNLREANREQVARQNLGELQRRSEQGAFREATQPAQELVRDSSQGEIGARWGEGTRRIRTAEEKAESARKGQRTIEERQREMEQIEQLQEENLRQRLERLRPQPIDTTPPVSRQVSVEGTMPIEELEERFSNLQQ